MNLVQKYFGKNLFDDSYINSLKRYDVIIYLEKKR